jgi:hypothetical protein
MNIVYIHFWSVFKEILQNCVTHELHMFYRCVTTRLGPGAARTTLLKQTMNHPDGGLYL